METPGGAMKTAKNVTASLHRVRITLEKALQGSEVATNQLYRYYYMNALNIILNAFGSDGELISDTEAEHAYHLRGALGSTKKRLNAVKTAELWERYSIFGSLCFFFSVVVYIVAKRTRLLYLIGLFVGGMLGGKENILPDKSMHITDRGLAGCFSEDGSYMSKDEMTALSTRQVEEGHVQCDKASRSSTSHDASARVGEVYIEDSVSFPDWCEEEEKRATPVAQSVLIGNDDRRTADEL